MTPARSWRGRLPDGRQLELFVQERPSDRPRVTAGKAELDSEPVALCEQTACCGRVVALGAHHLSQVGQQALGADPAGAPDKVRRAAKGPPSRDLVLFRSLKSRA